MKRINKTSPFAVIAFIAFLLCANIMAQGTGTPAFSQYRVRVSKAKPKPVRLNTRNARMFRTRLREANKANINFAGHYIVASWGCGTSCLQGAIIDIHTGRVFFPDELFKGFGMQLGHPDSSFEKYGYFEHRPDSKLLILNGWAGDRYGVRFLVWEGNRFRLVKFVPVEPGAPDSTEDIDGKHLSVVNRWLRSNKAWRLAQTDDYDPEIMKLAKADLGDGYTPYYVQGDFNGDSHDDFAVILAGTDANNRYGAAVFNGPFNTAMPRTPAFFTDKLQQGDALFLQDKLIIGPYASDNIFFLIPFGDTYKVEEPDMGI